MKILLSGLHREADVERLRERMSHFGPVLDIRPVTEGDPDRPWFVIELAVSAGEATEIARRIDGIYFNERILHAWVMLRE